MRKSESGVIGFCRYAMRDVEDLVNAAQELKQELEHAGNYVVPVSSVRKTEEIEKLARRIRGRLKN